MKNRESLEMTHKMLVIPFGGRKKTRTIRVSRGNGWTGDAVIRGTVDKSR